MICILTKMLEHYSHPDDRTKLSSMDHGTLRQHCIMDTANFYSTTYDACGYPPQNAQYSDENYLRGLADDDLIAAYTHVMNAQM
jgi:hypothetical protein